MRETTRERTFTPAELTGGNLAREPFQIAGDDRGAIYLRQLANDPVDDLHCVGIASFTFDQSDILKRSLAADSSARMARAFWATR